MSRMCIEEIEIRDADIFEILLDNFPDMIHSVDDNGNIIYTNRTAETLLGYSQEELVSMNVREIYADEVLEALEKGFTDLKRKGDKNVESILKAKDGTNIPVEIRSFSIYDDQGGFIRTFSILRDIREIKDLQQSLVHQGRLAAIGELASGVAHDINNPLTVILLSNEMQLRELGRMQIEEKTPEARINACSQDIQRASKSIQKLADHLRNFSRGIAERYEVMDLHSAIADAIFISNNRVMSANVTIINNVEEGKYFISGCSNHMEQVFVNLISNACDAMAGKDKRELTITISPCKQDDLDYWKCDVADSGEGIPQDLVDDIFHSFFTTKEKGKGTGLGLSISRGIIRDHKGNITVESQPDKGTTFSVYLPTAQLETQQ